MLKSFMEIDKLIKKFGEPYSKVLGIDLDSKKESEIFKWFLASILFGKRIGENIAIKTYKTFVKYNVLTPKKILDAGWDELVRILDEGGYVRYDFSTATKLLEISKKMLKDYGSLTNLYKKAKDAKDLEQKLLEFKGVGPVTVNIFLRELRVVWPKSDTGLCPLSLKAAKRLRIKLEKGRTKKFIRFEVALLRLWNHFYKKGKKPEI